jgi:bifunctional DNA-binding transcriptional regulator/antitoxin component of YhaV-PrlF toxin-antitoxin module
MQNQMKSQPPLFALVPVPYEVLVDAGIEIGDPLQFIVEKGKVTMEKISPEDMNFVCDGNCEGCPMLLLDCTGECAPVIIAVMKARCSNMAQMFRILGKRGRITIPFEIRQRVGFSYNDVLSFTEAPDGRTVIVKREKICDNCAAEKPQRKDAEDTITLFDFLNSLSDEQQKAAFAHLKLKWDHVQGSGLYGRS